MFRQNTNDEYFLLFLFRILRKKTERHINKLQNIIFDNVQNITSRNEVLKEDIMMLINIKKLHHISHTQIFRLTNNMAYYSRLHYIILSVNSKIIL